jgi:hypothetical protein
MSEEDTKATQGEQEATPTPTAKPTRKRKSALMQAMQEQDEALKGGTPPQNSDASVQGSNAVQSGITSQDIETPSSIETPVQNIDVPQNINTPQDSQEVQEGAPPQDSREDEEAAHSQGPQKGKEVIGGTPPQNSTKTVDKSAIPQNSTKTQKGKEVIESKKVQKVVEPQKGKEVLEGEGPQDQEEEALEKVTFYIPASLLEKLEDKVYEYKKRTKVRRANRNDIVRLLLEQHLDSV